jgi:hypothetical protein
VAKEMEGLSPDTWIISSRGYHYKDFDNYILTVYFVTSTMATIGFGDIVPKTNSKSFVFHSLSNFQVEICLGIFTMIFGLLFYALTIGILHSIFRNVDIR